MRYSLELLSINLTPKSGASREQNSRWGKGILMMSSEPLDSTVPEADPLPVT